MKTDSGHFWLGDEDSLLSHLKAEEKLHATPTAQLQDMSIRAMSEAATEVGEFGEFDYMVSRAGNLAVVNVSGSLTSKNRPYNRYVGMVSYDEIRNALITAVESDGVKGIVLNMDTPGGQATGISELGDFIAEVDGNIMPVYTYAGTTMASGGYWLGSYGREIFASKLASVGSIGVVTMHASYEKMYKDAGIEVTVLRSGEFKALGSPYEKLDDKARSQIQSQMDAIYDVFLDTVAENRGMSVPVLKENAAEGRVFIGADSVTVGLADNITSFDAAIAQISKEVQSSPTRTPFKPRSETILGELDMPGKKKILTEAGVAAIESGVPEADVLNNPEMVEEVEAEETDGQEAEASVEEGTEAEDTEVSSDGEGGDAADDDDGDSAPAVSADLMDKMFNKVSDLTVETANLKADNAKLERERDEAVSTESALCQIAVQAINKMQVSLGGVPMKLADSGASVILEQYNRTYTQFNQKFKVGAAAEVPNEDDFNVDAGGKSNAAVEAAVTRLTTSKVK